MRFNKLDLNLLVALDALLTARNISRAAEKVHVSQSTMSHALARLREHFKDELLVQVGRRMELTPRALSMCDPIRDVLVRISSTIDNPPEFDPAQSDREFVLQVSDYSMQTLFPHVLAVAERQRSRIRFKLEPQAGNPARSLERGEVDLLVIPEAYCSTSHPMEPLLKEGYVAVMWDGSRLAQDELTMERYQNAKHIVMAPAGTNQPAHESWLVQRYGISRDVVVSSYSFTALASMVVGTEFMATVHARLAYRAARAFPLKLTSLPFAMDPVVQAMQWHAHRTGDPGLTWLRSTLKEAAHRLVSDATESAPSRAAE